jgi:hypothetical protein
VVTGPIKVTVNSIVVSMVEVTAANKVAVSTVGAEANMADAGIMAEAMVEIKAEASVTTSITNLVTVAVATINKPTLRRKS